MKKLFTLICLFSFSVASSQNFEESWQGHFSYLDIKDVVSSNGRVYAAAENALFFFDALNPEIETITTVQGLSGETISTLYYSEVYQLIVIGYENGLIEIYDENTEEVTTVIDILDKPTIPPENKRINHFNEFNQFVYIATDFGISVYDLERFEFGDTYFIGNQGAQIIVTQTEVFGDYIYASCRDNSGLRRALVASDDLIDFQEWDQISGGNYVGVESFGNSLYATRTNRGIYEVDGTSVSLLFTYDNTPLDIKNTGTHLAVTTFKEVYVYNEGFVLLQNILRDDTVYERFRVATTTPESMYVGTNGTGLLKIDFSATEEIETIVPTGPLRNNAFAIKASRGDLWVSYGDYTLTYSPAPRREFGLSRLRESIWENIPYDTIQTAVGGRASNLNTISVNPNNQNQAFISSFNDGILEMDNLEPIELFNESNSGLESLVVPSNPDFKSIRVSGTEFDSNGLLWTITSRVDSPLKSYNPESGIWTSYDFTSIIADGFSDETGFSEIVIGPDGTKWIGALESGLIGFNETGGQILLRNIFDDDIANLPSSGVWSIAIDRRNQMWLGTNKGLRVLFNTTNFFTAPTVTTQAIIILEDGIPKELLEQQFVSDIQVDGGNNKWVSTIGSGAFYFSQDGQETIFHFTKDNSPLPSNNVNKIEIDRDIGVVYFATDKGIVSFRAGGSAPQDDLEGAFVFPNPVRPGFDMAEKKVKIQDISENCNIKITDIEGNLVAEAQSNTNLRFNGYNLEIEGGTAFWNGKNLANNTVASGVYLVLISDLDDFETKVLKLMVVR